MNKLIYITAALLIFAGCASKQEFHVTGAGDLKSDVKTYDFVFEQDPDADTVKYAGMLEEKLKCAGWERDKNSPEYMLAPTFAEVKAKEIGGSKTSYGVGLGIGSGLGSGFGAGLSLNTLFGAAEKPDKDTKVLDLKLYEAGKAYAEPQWHGRVISQDDSSSFGETVPVLIKFAVENFGKTFEGRKDFSFDATEENMAALEKCPL